MEMPVEDFAYWLGKFVLEVPVRKKMARSTHRKLCIVWWVVLNKRTGSIQQQQVSNALAPVFNKPKTTGKENLKPTEDDDLCH